MEDIFFGAFETNLRPFLFSGLVRLGSRTYPTKEKRRIKSPSEKKHVIVGFFILEKNYSGAYYISLLSVLKFKTKKLRKRMTGNV